MDDVAWETSEAERKFSAKKENSANEHEKTAEEDQRAADFAERFHPVHFSRNIWLRSFGTLDECLQDNKRTKNRDQINSMPEKK